MDKEKQLETFQRRIKRVLFTQEEIQEAIQKAPLRRQLPWIPPRGLRRQRSGEAWCRTISSASVAAIF